MRRKMLGSVAVWLAGGVAIAGDAPGAQMVGVLPGDPVPPMFPIVPMPPGGLPPGQQLVPIGARQSGAEAKSSPLSLQPIVQASAAAPGLLPAPASPAVPYTASVLDEPTTVAGPADVRHDDGDADRWFGSFDYLVFWVRRNPTPGLVQVLPADLANFARNGETLPPGATTTLFGANGTDPGALDGVRAQLGLWLTPDHCWGVDASYLHLFQKADTFSLASAGTPVFGREFFDAGANSPAFLQYTFPGGSSTGFININAPVEMYTFDANIRRQGPSVFSDRVDYLAGLRYLNLRDAISIDSGATIQNPNGGLPRVITSHESFRAKNEFYGSQLGFDAHSRYGCWTADLSGKVAAGWVHQQVDIAGSAIDQIGAAAPVVLPNQSILYVQRSNAGSYSRDRFAVVPEILVKLGYQITPHIRAGVGYNILTVTSVQRSGAAIDPGVNPSLARFISVDQESNARRPVFGFSGTDFWAQGLTFGLTVTY